MFYFKFTAGTWNDGDFGGGTASGGTAFICEWDTEEAYQNYLKNKNQTGVEDPNPGSIDIVYTPEDEKPLVEDRFWSTYSSSKWDNMPFYNINGDEDYQANYMLAGDYFDKVNAPSKELLIMGHTTHGLMESKSEDFSEILHYLAGNHSN